MALVYTKKISMPFFLFTLLWFAGCSSKKSANPVTAEEKQYAQIYASHRPLHEACMEHRENILEQAVTEIAEAPEDDDNYLFVPNEADAAYFIEYFDLSKFTLKENQKEYEALVNACINGPQASHATCDTLLAAYKYFRALIPAIAHHSWSQTLKKKALKNMLSYLTYVAQSESSIMDVMLANDLLQRLSEKKLVSPDLRQDCKHLRRKAEKLFEGLRSEVRKLGKKEMSCEQAKSFYLQERKRVVALSQEFLLLLRKVAP